MKRKDFLLTSLLAIPGIGIAKETIIRKNIDSGKEPFISEVTNRRIGHNFLVFQIIFFPGALYRLTGIHAAELTNQYMDAENLFSSSLRDVNEQLHHAKCYADMVETANAFIRMLIRKQKKSRLRIDDTLFHFLKIDSKISIEKLSAEACLSTKQLERKFKERTGVNPKLYARIIRFDRAFRLKNSRPELDWLRIAMECDYHDYQHLAKDYKDFTSLSPNGFHEIESKAPERSFGLSEGYYE